MSGRAVQQASGGSTGPQAASMSAPEPYRLHVRRERLEAAVVVDVAFGERHRMVGGIAHPKCGCITTGSTAFW